MRIVILLILILASSCSKVNEKCTYSVMSRNISVVNFNDDYRASQSAIFLDDSNSDVLPSKNFVQVKNTARDGWRCLATIENERLIIYSQYPMFKVVGDTNMVQIVKMESSKFHEFYSRTVPSKYLKLNSIYLDNDCTP